MDYREWCSLHRRLTVHTLQTQFMDPGYSISPSKVSRENSWGDRFERSKFSDHAASEQRVNKRGGKQVSRIISIRIELSPLFPRIRSAYGTWKLFPRFLLFEFEQGRGEWFESFYRFIKFLRSPLRSTFSFLFLFLIFFSVSKLRNEREETLVSSTGTQ